MGKSWTWEGDINMIGEFAGTAHNAIPHIGSLSEVAKEEQLSSVFINLWVSRHALRREKAVPRSFSEVF
tara:strand:+ start:802 stop:1008 length:207 start_codon:yes stop_codon:yes gene_type:complete